MSEYKETYQSELMRFDNPYAYLSLTDFGEGRGLLQIHSDWGTYSYYWGSMGTTIKKFLASTSASYVHGKLQSTLNYQDMKKDSKIRLDRFMINSWPDILIKLREDAKEQPHD